MLRSEGRFETLPNSKCRASFSHSGSLSRAGRSPPAGVSSLGAKAIADMQHVLDELSTTLAALYLSSSTSIFPSSSSSSSAAEAENTSLPSFDARGVAFSPSVLLGLGEGRERWEGVTGDGASRVGVGVDGAGRATLGCSFIREIGDGFIWLQPGR